MATLQTKVGDEDTANTLSHYVVMLKENKLDLSGGKMTGDINMGHTGFATWAVTVSVAFAPSQMVG